MCGENTLQGAASFCSWAWVWPLAASAAFSCAATLPNSRTPEVSKSYTVGAGETLWRIAQAHRVSVDALMAENGIDDPTRLQIGQQLSIPGSTEGSSAALKRAKSLASGRSGPSSSGEEAEVRAQTTMRSVSSTPSAPRSSPRSRRVSVARYPLRWPLHGRVLRRYGRRSKKHHDGIDIEAKRGDPVRAAGSGTVLFANEHGGYGKLILLRHASGVITVYAHQSELLVKKGDKVEGGEMIARVGATGAADQPHLHFEVRRGIEPQNPLQFLPP